jgi:hypothetical protein
MPGVEKLEFEDEEEDMNESLQRKKHYRIRFAYDGIQLNEEMIKDFKEKAWHEYLNDLDATEKETSKRSDTRFKEWLEHFTDFNELSEE